MPDYRIPELESLGLDQDDLNLENISRKFVDLVFKVFSFDRVALFAVKKNESLQGKVSKGFDSGQIKKISIPLTSDSAMITPLVTGRPYNANRQKFDPFLAKLALSRFALIPIITRRPAPCWKVKACRSINCPAYGKRWLRCWLTSGTNSSDGIDINKEEKQKKCLLCPMYMSNNDDAPEWLLLVDNSISDKNISRDTITAITIMAHAIGQTITNSCSQATILSDSIKDELTRLHNRHYFKERLLDELDRAKRYQERVSLLKCSVDQLKHINETYGHPAGDSVLIWLSSILRERQSRNDLLARTSGKEFSILLTDTNKNEALNEAEIIRDLIENSRFSFNNRSINITISFGVATFGEDSNSFEGLLAKAIRCLHQAKVLGGNRVCGTNDLNLTDLFEF